MGLYNQEAEQSILGSCLNGQADNIIPHIKPNEFIEQRHQLIYKTLSNMYQEDKPISLTTLHEQLRFKNEIDKVGVMYLTELATKQTYTLEQDISLIKQNAYIYNFSNILNKFQQIVKGNHYKSLDELKETFETELNDLGDTKREQLVSAYDVMVNHVETIFERKKTDGIARVRSFIGKLDFMTGGWKPGQLIIIGARPGIGKSVVAEQVAIDNALNKNTVAMFSLEMVKEEILERALSNKSGVPFQCIRTGETENFVKPITNGVAKISLDNLFLCDDFSINLAEIKSQARKLRRSKGLDILIIDYLTLIEGEKAENRNQEIGKITRSLKKLSRELEIPIIVLSQLSRKPDGRSQTRPILSDLRESGNIEQDADQVIFIHRERAGKDSEEEYDNETEFIVAKNRGGKTGRIKATFEGDYQRFSEWVIEAQQLPVEKG
ncbi:MAG: hypothetical protein JM58_09570 [Peptococcaceae bacterium BICA1-8]|nr:MAG: hypothetical protein JM58_09570 [Peptococcaceae bacterium BICA1-8]